MGLARRAILAGLWLAAGCVVFAETTDEHGKTTFASEDVVYPNANAPGVQLAGTFSKPNDKGTSPAVLLISGAGPQDRDESMAGHKPFLVLARYLTERNIAVLRVDDRGVGQSTGKFDDATTKDFASDAEASLRYLAGRPDVDPKHVGVIGHGEGAIIAAMLATSTPQVSFAVLLSGTAVPGAKVLLTQTERAQMAAGLPPEQIEADARLGAGLYKMAMEGRSESEMRVALGGVPEEYKSFIDPWQRQIPKLQSPWLRYFLRYDPSVALEQIKCPVLALYGDKDMTLDPDQNASAMKKAFNKGHNREAKVRTLPGLNYLFQKANTGLGAEYAKIQEDMSPVALEAIYSFVAAQVQ